MRSASDLIDDLMADLRPAPRAYVGMRLTVGIGAGALIASAITLTLWGPRPDLATAVSTWPFWMKAGFTAWLAIAGAASVIKLARPGQRAAGAALAVSLAVAVMAALAALQLARTPADASRRLLLGSTAASCPWLIVALAVPIFMGALWAMRFMAPTRLAQAGAAMGFMAGSLAAFVYAVSCDESAAPFVLIWYGLGIVVPTVAGGLLGPRVLRW